MKKLLFITLLLNATLGYSQDTLMKPMLRKKPEIRKEYFSIYRIFPNGIGDNVLAKAHNGQGAVGVTVTFYAYNRFHIMGLYEFIQYEVTDRSLAANVQYSNLANYGLRGLYKIPIVNRFDLNPKFSVAHMTLHQRDNRSSYGRQKGYGLSAGFDADFRIAGGFRVFAGLGYAWSFPKTHTNEEYKSFFGSLQQMNVQLGIKF
jgi:opacity protein-like surface antigen